MIVRVTFKTPDAVEYAVRAEAHRNLDNPDLESVEEETRHAMKSIKTFVRYGEYITVEFDTIDNTAIVVPVR